MSEELKLCPFCGKAHPTRVGRGIVYRNDDLATKEVAENYQHAITFLDGGLPCPFSLLVVTAEQWNTRPLEDAQTAEIARLQSELQQAREALNNLRLATANYMRLEDSEDEDKSWSALETLSKALGEASAALPNPPEQDQA